MNNVITIVAPFSADADREPLHEAPAPDVSEAAMSRLRSPFDAADGDSSPTASERGTAGRRSAA